MHLKSCVHQRKRRQSIALKSLLILALAEGRALRHHRGMTDHTSPPLNPAELGQTSTLPTSPEDAKLDPVPNPHRDVDYLARFVAPEFTSICPVTGQPDFAHLVIDYCPDMHLVESKSLKLLLGAYRNHGAFHEDCTIDIAKRIIAAVAPKWLRISGYWYPRGGIPIDVFYQTGEPPKGVYIPDTGVAPYRGRG